MSRKQKIDKTQGPDSPKGETLVEVFEDEKPKRVYALALRDALTLALAVAPKKGPFAYVHVGEGRVRAASPAAVVSVSTGKALDVRGTMARLEAQRMGDWLRGHPEAWVSSWTDEALSLAVPGQPKATRSPAFTFGVDRLWPSVSDHRSPPASGSLYDAAIVSRAARYSGGGVSFAGLPGGYLLVTAANARLMLAPFGEAIYDGQEIEGVLASPGGEL